MIFISYSIPNFSSISAALLITGISESLPITIPTFAMILLLPVSVLFRRALFRKAARSVSL